MGAKNLNTKGEKNIISFLFLAGEGVACYQGLYLRNKIAPSILAIIQPGHSLGGNWTNFFNPEAFFWKTVKKGTLPDTLLLGEFIEVRRSFFERYMYYAPYKCPFGEEYLDVTRINVCPSNWAAEKIIGVFELDKRTSAQKDQDLIDNKNKYEELKRLSEIANLEKIRLKNDWFEQGKYKLLRLRFRRAPSLPFDLIEAESIQKQLLDVEINCMRASFDMFGALRRKDILAISALIKRGADIYYTNTDGLSVLEYASMLGFESMLLLEKANAVGQIKSVFSFCINKYCEALAVYETDKHFDFFIAPCLSQLDLQQITKLITSIDSNKALRLRARTKDNHLSIRARAVELGLDVAPYSNFLNGLNP